MAFKLFEEAVARNRAAWNEHISLPVRVRLDDSRPITKAEYEELRLNSFERQEVIPRLDNEAFLYHAENILNNCTPTKCRYGCELPGTYDQAAIQLLRYAIERMKDLTAHDQKTAIPLG